MEEGAGSLEAWAEAKAFLQAQVGKLPKALVRPDQGGPFLSHEWVGTLLLRDGQRLSYSLMGAKGNPVVESFFARFKGRVRDTTPRTWGGPRRRGGGRGGLPLGAPRPFGGSASPGRS
ncbi:hypothetical protein GCM10007092_02950 [Thermus composti]|nr:hypothetical protein GCM10007092_02950 [Thermus composti]